MRTWRKRTGLGVLALCLGLLLAPGGAPAVHGAEKTEEGTETSDLMASVQE